MEMQVFVGDCEALLADDVNHGISLIERKMRQVYVDLVIFVGDVLYTKQMLRPIR